MNLSMPPNTSIVLQMREIRKAFAGVQAVRGVDFEVRAGEILGLVGENGAGKSTLMHILSGALAPDSGEIIWRGRPVRFASPQSALAAGVAMIHQELSLVPSLPVAANIFLGHEPGPAGRFLSLGEANRRAERLLHDLDTPVDVTRNVEEYNLAVQQMIEVAKALSHEASLLIMDEPTSALSDAETERLFAVIRSLRDRGVAVIYITHKLEEIYALCDRITVLRDGEKIGTAAAGDLPREQMIQWMVGRKIEQLFPERHAQPGEEVLRVEGLSLTGEGGRRLVEGVSLALHAGEIAGLAGLRGSGASEVLGSLFGQYGRRPRGEVYLRGRRLRPDSPARALRAGISLLTNDRKATGLVLPMSILHNLTMAALPRLTPGGIVRRSREVAAARPVAESMHLRAPSLDAEVNALSGGNQQKVALGKWLLTEPQVLLLDEPTRGIDVGAKAEIYDLMNQLTAAGKGILLITSELPELLAMSDRILVLHRGKVTAELSREEATQERVMSAAV
jgi:ABC-type sugar transport system ATPase subunit